MKVGLIIVAGLVAGVAAKMADDAQARWINDLANHPAAWALALALIGRMAPTGPQAALRSTAFFVAMSLAYYAWSAYVLEFVGLTPFVVAWTALALTIVPGLAISIWWASRRSGALPGAFMATLAATALAGGAVWQLWLYAEGALPDGFPLHPVQAAVDVLVAAVIAGLLPAHARTRVWALVLTVPMFLVVRVLVDWAYGHLPLG